MPPLLRHTLLLVALFAAVTAIAAVAGAANLGTALTFGQVAFAAALVVLMLRAPRDPGADAADQGSGRSAE
ncbi:MAG: hypothetical protein PGN13_01900 [Patulibacter minatonensis]